MTSSRDRDTQAESNDVPTEAVIVREGTPGDRIAMVWAMTLEAWAASGRPIPDYPRHAAPGRIIRASDD